MFAGHQPQLAHGCPHGHHRSAFAFGADGHRIRAGAPAAAGGPASPFLHLDGEDWYCTGDLVRADSNGHMTFAGRRERFVKLGGEMISLPQMEAVLGRHFMAPAGQEGPVLAVDALEEEGQTVLVLFTTLPLEREQTNAVLREEGLSALYMLRRVRRLAALPLLGSGKVDYRSLRALAMQEGQGV